MNGTDPFAVGRGEHDFTWLVLGASGFVGSALVAHLAATGQRVLTLSTPRLTCDPSLNAGEICSVAEGHASLPELSSALKGVNCVVIAAGAAKPNAPWTAALVGANSLLPGVVACAAMEAGVGRLVHISSAAVQGRTRTLTETLDTSPFSAYSRSKALGERVIVQLAAGRKYDIVTVRATSVQGPNRETTKSLRRIARSPFASVAGSGNQPSAVSSIDNLCAFVRAIGSWTGEVPPLVLQPWDGLSVRQVLCSAGGKPPIRLPRAPCRWVISVGYAASRVLGGRLDGHVRRLEVMWFGQAVAAEWAQRMGFVPQDTLGAILCGDAT